MKIVVINSDEDQEGESDGAFGYEDDVAEGGKLLEEESVSF